MTSPEIRRAVEGVISVKDLMEERVFSKVFFSKKAPNAKRKVTIADSSYSWIKRAAITAIDTNNSIETCLNLSAWTAWKAIGTRPINVANKSAKAQRK